MLRKAFTASLVVVSFTALACAQDKPNFSGTWKLNTVKSDFGMFPPVESGTEVIKHADPNLKISTTVEKGQGKQQFTLNYTTDGKESVNKMGPGEMKSTVTWAGNVLVIDSKLNFNDADKDMTIKDKWTLSEDGKTKTIDSHLASAMGETDQKLIFEKQ